MKIQFYLFPTAIALLLILAVQCHSFAIDHAYSKLADYFNATTGPPSSLDISDAMIDKFYNLSGEARVSIETVVASNRRLAYVDGSGWYIGSDEVHHYASGVKCWSDYFSVEMGYWYGPWSKASGNVYCTGTSDCSIAHMSGHTTCESWSISVSSGIADGFINFGVTAGYDHQNCFEGTDTTQCTWNDQQCHCIWTQQQMTYQNGYKRRRCSSNHGDYTAWMQNIVHDAPTNRVSYGCGSKCSD
ncbi:hypothetical protein O6H91_21G034000 [Diphasiastrum complanatum]|uniref:Uncharacterized protein n=1 Tax=Diphasiastrum complanatum TaxID=34168 RepID=A0ACC2AJK0_DIPCM|nr:hypothetical protein O6H91_21G034000 [Diphasiastrum complanatum]